jgi:hypothetical protein
MVVRGERAANLHRILNSSRFIRVHNRNSEHEPVSTASGQLAWLGAHHSRMGDMSMHLHESEMFDRG